MFRRWASAWQAFELFPRTEPQIEHPFRLGLGRGYLFYKSAGWLQGFDFNRHDGRSGYSESLLSGRSGSGGRLADRSFHLELDEAVQFDRVFHRQLFDELLHEAGDDYGPGLDSDSPLLIR